MSVQISVSYEEKRGVDRPMGLWLLTCCVIIFALIVLGGFTRLTHSGLSMVEWRPFMGFLPPLTEGDWQRVFQKYRLFPEYQLINHGMTLAEFKTIFWIEYAHRLVARLAGIVFLVPFLYFLLAGRLNKSLVRVLVAVLALGILQALLGWYMVQSGLADRPEVSQYRLVAHLGLAVIIYGSLFWLALGILGGASDSRSISKSSAARVTSAFTTFVFIVILSGGIVAGLDAGFGFNTFPLMDNQVIPTGVFPLTPWWINFFNDPLTAQFNHRALAILITIVGSILWWRFHRSNVSRVIRIWFRVVVAALAAQATLGILTLVYVVPIPLAVAHQAGALLLFTASLGLTRSTMKP